MTFANRFRSRVFGFLAPLAFSAPIQAQQGADGARAVQPNVILIMADDLGWETLGAYGNEEYETPELDALAEEGVTFEYCFSTPLCTPTRVMLMTGLYGHRNYRAFGQFPKEDEKRTIGNLMKEAGYATCMAGKWHVKGVEAGTMGFDRAMRAENWKSYWGTENIWVDDKKLKPGEAEKLFPGLEYRPDMVVKFITDFIDSNREQPFFVYFPMFLVHHPEMPTPDSADLEAFQADPEAWELHEGTFEDMVKYMDKLVGQIVSHVEELGLRENTIILFTGDNGTSLHRVEIEGETVGGGKGSMKDNGTRVPLVASWKGSGGPTGLMSDALVDFTDFFPTLAEAAGIPTRTVWRDGGDIDELRKESSDLSARPIATDGVSFLPVLQGKEAPLREWAFMHYKGRNTGNWPVKSGAYWVRNDQYKLYGDGRMFEVADWREQNPIEDNPEAASARESLEAVFETLGATPETIVSEEEEQAYKDKKKNARNNPPQE
ncbi:MAG: sulfatase-like hydrolase/transferase [Chthoniobacterales bacterium]